MNRHDIEILSKVVAQQIGEGPSLERIQAQREAVMTHFDEIQITVPQRNVIKWRWAFTGLILGVLLGGIGWWYWGTRSKTVHFQMQKEAHIVQLPNGNEMRLAAGSHGSVKEASSDQVRLLLVRGKLTSVVRTPVRWCVEAGPYYVEAAGTEYTVQWEEPRLEVTVAQGKVTVSRQGNGNAHWKVEAGGRLVLEDGTRPEKTSFENVEEPAFEMAVNGIPQAAKEEVTSTSQPTPTLYTTPNGKREQLLRKEEPTKNVAVQPEKQVESEIPAWKRFLKAEDYKSAVEALERAGLATFADTASLSDLQSMATAARYAGKPQTALVLLVSIRTRFPKTLAASVAAFLMGRVYSEQLGNHRAAVGWFSTYLGEAPEGALAEEALGRRMDAAYRCGMHTQAQESARQLLERFPKSPFATLARKIAGL